MIFGWWSLLWKYLKFLAHKSWWKWYKHDRLNIFIDVQFQWSWHKCWLQGYFRHWNTYQYFITISHRKLLIGHAMMTYPRSCHRTQAQVATVPVYFAIHDPVGTKFCIGHQKPIASCTAWVNCIRWFGSMSWVIDCALMACSIGH